MALQIGKKNNINIIGNLGAEQTILFGHGFGLDQTCFSQIVEHFKEDYRIILFDNVGAGKSDLNAYDAGRYSTLAGYVSDLSDICRYLQLQNVIYVGHSVCGMVGAMVSNKNETYFSKLIFLGASPRYLNDATTNYIGGFEESDLAGLYQAMEANYHAWASGFSAMAMANPDRPELAQAFAHSLSAMRPDIALCVAKAIFGSDHRQELKLIKKPVLVVQTAEDIAVPGAVGKYLHANIEGSKFMMINATGHFPQLSAPNEVVKAIRSFL